MPEIECVPELPVNRHFDERYLSGPTLGVGGVGEVTLYADRFIGREVALKTLRVSEGESTGASTERFLREARVQGQLEHPSIVPVYECGVRPDGREYFTMKRVRGATLGDVLRGRAQPDGDSDRVGPYGRRRLLEAFVRVCLAVDFAHARGIVHRDLKPSNIMLGDFGEVYVLDWGVAKVLAGAASDAGMPEPTGVTATGATEQGKWLGTPGYMAPEQLEAEAVDARTDVYALGVLLFEILTGRPLHGPGQPVDLVRSTLSGAEARPSQRCPEVELPPEFDAILVRATARRPEDRYPTARALCQDVERYLDGDRDLALRRGLAARHAEAARAALGQAESSPEASEDGRSRALRNAGKALALDPNQAGALEVLGRLLLTEPPCEPTEVKVAMQQSAATLRHRTVRSLFYRSLSWVAVVPLALWVGQVAPVASAVIISMVLGTSLLIAAACRLRSVSIPVGFLLLVVTTVLFAVLSALYGPFTLVPTLIATNTVFFVLHSNPGQRRVIVALGVLATVLPFLGELVGLIPPSCQFLGDRIVILPRTLAFPATGTKVLLLVTHVMMVIAPALFAAGVRNALLAAERKLFLHSWQVGQLAADLRAGERGSLSGAVE
jgi:serine/threonine-protein kinase